LGGNNNFNHAGFGILARRSLGLIYPHAFTITSLYFPRSIVHTQENEHDTNKSSRDRYALRRVYIGYEQSRYDNIGTVLFEGKLQRALDKAEQTSKVQVGYEDKDWCVAKTRS
jgi:hypothetical protein